MAEIMENLYGRRMIRMSTDDIISVVREYQNAVSGANSYEQIRNKLDIIQIYLPEDII